MDNNYKRAEAILYNVPILRTEIKNLKLDLEELLEDYQGITSSSNEIAAGRPTYKTGSAVENEIVQRDKRITYLKQQITKKERELQKIENILVTLTEEERALVEYKYFRRLSVHQICGKLDIHHDTYCKRRRSLIQLRIIPLLFH